MKHASPFFVGIAGGTGSGKTTVARKVAAGLPLGAAAIVEHDNYYREHAEVPERQRAQINYDHPASLDNDHLIADLQALKDGRSIEMPLYDYKTHRRRPESKRIEPTPVIVVEGILVFVDDRLRNLFDLKIFVDTDADIRIMRRVRRDIEDRGRSFADIREQYYRSVRPMHQKYVEPCKRYADLIIPEGGSNIVALDAIVGNLLHVLRL